MLYDHFQSDDKKVVLNICGVFDSLGNKAPDLNMPNSFFMNNIPSFIGFLLQCAHRSDLTYDDLGLVDKSLSA